MLEVGDMIFQGELWLLLLVFWPIAGAFLCYLLGKMEKDWRDYFTNFVVATTFLAMLYLVLAADFRYPPFFEWNNFMGLRIYFRLDGWRAIYGVVTAFMWLVTNLFSREYFAHHHNR